MSTEGAGRKPFGRSMAQLRQADLAKIHMAAKQLQMPRDVYEAMLWMIAKVKSSKELDAVGRQKVLKHLQQLGAKFQHKRVNTPRTKKHFADKIIAMMLSLEYSDAYVDGMALRMFKVEKWEWLEVGDMEKLMIALAIHQRRKEDQEEERQAMAHQEISIPSQPDAGNQ